MNRKSYLLVKVPTGTPEINTKSSQETRIKKDVHKSVISFNRKVRKGLKFSVQDFPEENRSFSIIHARSNSEVRSHFSPVKMRKYVESMLQCKRNNSSRLTAAHQSSFVKAKSIQAKRVVNMRSRLLPLFLQLKSELN
jgi:hypothetical protein